MDHVGSTISAPKFMKKFIAAGTNNHQEKSKPSQNNKPDPKTTRKIREKCILVRPGELNNTT